MHRTADRFQTVAALANVNTDADYRWMTAFQVFLAETLFCALKVLTEVCHCRTITGADGVAGHDDTRWAGTALAALGVREGDCATLR